MVAPPDQHLQVRPARLRLREPGDNDERLSSEGSKNFEPVRLAMAAQTMPRILFTTARVVLFALIKV
jgi:hypothetical protein